MTQSDSAIALLGLGRMGASMAIALQEHGSHVTGWNRSRMEAPTELTVVDDAGLALAGADVVLLSLFDADACREVLEKCRDSLRPEALVINTSTVSPGEAVELARLVKASGSRYVHAPVLGSVPAVRAGRLVVLAGGEAGHVSEARNILEPLAEEVWHVGDAAAAAALKLVANASLAGAVVALGEVLEAAEALGLDRDAAMDVIARGPLGGLAETKRDRLTEGRRDAKADFTIGALLKDANLLSTASGLTSHATRELRRILADSTVSPTEDIASIALVPSLPGAGIDETLAPLASYARGHATGDPRYFRDAFLPTAHVEGLRDGVFTSWDLASYCALFDGKPAADEDLRSRRVDHVEVRGSVATATMTLDHGSVVFTDKFVLLDGPEGWRIANKVYHRHRRAGR